MKVVFGKGSDKVMKKNPALSAILFTIIDFKEDYLSLHTYQTTQNIPTHCSGGFLS